ncbi:MAG: ROK family protein, partial [Bacillota bacterium]
PRWVRGRIRAVGVGAPGIVEAGTGRVLLAPNLRWQDVPLGPLLQERLQMQVYVDNDANCAALGEQLAGAGRGARHLLMVTLGTGVGAGLVLDGQLYRGAGGFAGEVGHIPVLPDGPLCGCGRRGCLETLCSATAVAAMARQAVSDGRGAAIVAAARRVAQGQVDARAVMAAARWKDPVALAILREAGTYLGIGLAILVNLFNPERIVVGGSLSRAGEALLGPAREELGRRALPGPAQQVAVVPAGLGNQAGMVGAAALALGWGRRQPDLGPAGAARAGAEAATE